MPTYTVSCVKRATGKPYTIDINAKTPADAERMALDTDHIVEHVALANDPIFADQPTTNRNTEQLQLTAVIAELRELRGEVKQTRLLRSPIRIIGSAVVWGLMLWSLLVFLFIMIIILWVPQLVRLAQDRNNPPANPPAIRGGR